MFNAFKIQDVLKCDFFRLPKALFVNTEYRKMSLEAKVTFALLYDRLSLSQQNNWINEENEVYLIFKREDIASELGISYRKSISAFRELSDAGLIHEKRMGRGMANRIYIAKLEITAGDAANYDYPKTAHDDTENCENGISENTESVDKPVDNLQAIQYPHIKNCHNNISRTAGFACQELPFLHTNNYTNINNTDFSNTNISQPVLGSAREEFDLERIKDSCQLDLFDTDTRKTFRDAIERLFYCRELKTGSALIPGVIVRQRLKELDYSVLDTARLNLYKNRDRPVKNITAYVMTTIYNCITENHSMTLVDNYLNTLRGEHRHVS